MLVLSFGVIVSLSNESCVSLRRITVFLFAIFNREGWNKLRWKQLYVIKKKTYKTNMSSEQVNRILWQLNNTFSKVVTTIMYYEIPIDQNI